MRAIRYRSAFLILVLALIELAPHQVIAASGNAVAPAEWRGHWLVAKDIGAPGISVLSEQQARAMIGKRILIGDGRAQFASETCNHATYEVQTQTLQDFLDDYRLTTAQLPLRGKQVHTLEVSCENGPFHNLSSLDDGRMLLVWEGHFFELRKGRSRPKQACTMLGSR